MSYRYRLLRDSREKEPVRYTMDELQSMGTFMLRDICVREKIMTHFAGLDPKRLNREELIRLIFRYRGRTEETLKEDFTEESVKILEELSKRAAAAAEKLEVPYKIEVKKDIPLLEEDGVRISHGFEGGYFLGALSDKENKILALFELRGERFSLSPRRMSGELLPGTYRDLQVVLFDAASSIGAVRAYNGQICDIHVERGMVAAISRLPILSIVEAGESEDPLVIDFGAGNTSAASQEHGDIREVRFQKDDCLCPSAAAVESCADRVVFRFGHEALALIRQGGYENSITFFHNLKLYLYEERKLDLCDSQGNASTVSSDLLLRQFFLYIISRARGEHGRNYRKIRFLLPEKRSCLALERFRQLLFDYQVEPARSESVNSIYERIAGQVEEIAAEEPAVDLVLHCGSSSSSLLACTYSVQNTKVSYHLNLREQYLNGDSSFGGNTLTYLILMYLKIKTAEELNGGSGSGGSILQGSVFEDSYSWVDQYGGTAEIYEGILKLYEEAEQALPTRYGQFDEYRLLKRQNFFRLWFLAEQIKLAFFSSPGISMIQLPGQLEEYCAVNAACGEGMREHRIRFCIHKAEIELLLAPEIYHLVKRFVEPLCDEYGILMGYRIRFTGLSCQIPLFRDALREFTVGRRARPGAGASLDLKLRAVRGEIRREQLEKSGRLIPDMAFQEASAAYSVAVKNHQGETVYLSSSGQPDRDIFGFVGRHTATREVQFAVCDAFGKQVGSRLVDLDIREFQKMGYEELFDQYPVFRPEQGDIDAIGEEEIRLFVFREQNWDFCVLPMARRQGELSVDRVRRFLFDNVSADYFSGDK